MLDDLPIVRFIVEAENGAKVFERGYQTLAISVNGGQKGLTQFQVLLRATHELRNPHRQAFRKDEVFTAE